MWDEEPALAFSSPRTYWPLTTLIYQLTNRCSDVLRVDGYNQASAGPSGNQGQMMGMSGRGGAIGPEGTANLGTPLMSENGAMVTYPEKFCRTYWKNFVKRITFEIFTVKQANEMCFLNCRRLIVLFLFLPLPTWINLNDELSLFWVHVWPLNMLRCLNASPCPPPSVTPNPYRVLQRSDRYPPQGGSAGGRPEVESPKQQPQQPPLGPQVGPGPGFGRGSPVGGVFDGPNNKRRRF